MKIGILDGGLMGKEAARELVISEDVSEVGLADIDLSRVKRVCEQLNSAKLTAYEVDAKNEKMLEHYIKKFDVIINALFYSFNESVAKVAIRVGTHSVDLGGHIGQVTERVLKLNEAAKKADVTVIPDLGVAPGAINILTGYAAEKLERVNEIKLYVGGIPVRPKAPIEYKQVFSMEGVLDHYTEPSLIIRKGIKQEIPSLSEVEPIYFNKFGPLEAFHTSGGTSTLPISFPKVKTLEYKTIRYPTHAKKFQFLIDLNLTKNDYEIEIDDRKVKPRDVLLKILNPIVELGKEEDVVLLRVVVRGEKANKKTQYPYEMITFKDMALQVTAMARVTVSTVVIVALMIGNGTITKRGVYPPEQIVSGDLYIKEMKKRNINIEESIETE